MAKSAKQVGRASEIMPEHGPVNPFVIGGGFLDYCVKRGWLIQEAKQRKYEYYVTKTGEKALKKFGIEV